MFTSEQIRASELTRHDSNVIDYLFTLIIIGDTGVGKSNILSRYGQNEFKQEFQTTIGVDFIIKKLILLEKGIRLHIWDLTGNERFRSVTKSYYRGARGAVLVYAVNDAQSFASISTYAKELDLSTNEGIFKILVGNKCDIGNRFITTEQGLQLAKGLNINYFLETSAKDDININEIFNQCAINILQTKHLGYDIKLSLFKERQQYQACF